MDPLTLMLLSGGIQAGSGLLGYLASLPDRAKAQRLIESATNELGQIDVPALEQVVAQEVGPSAYEQLRANPEAVAAQRSVLGRLGELADKGYTLEDKAAQMEALRQSGRQEQAGRQRILSDAAARGQLGGGTTLATLLQNQQGAAERGADIGLQTAAQNQRRAMEALRDRGQFAGNLRGQDWQEQAQAAQAKDMIARYNAEARRSAQGANIANQQWTYGQRRQRAGDKLGLAQAQADRLSGQAGQTAGMFAGTGAGIAQGINAYGNLRNRPQHQQQPQYGEDDYGWGAY